MHVIIRRSFEKDFSKCSAKVKMQTEKRTALYMKDRFHPLLRMHALRGEYEGCFSINVNADVRVIFYLDGDTIHLLRVGTHAQLYA
jgi:addiction module RelE/StbE family toxin